MTDLGLCLLNKEITMNKCTHFIRQTDTGLVYDVRSYMMHMISKYLIEGSVPFPENKNTGLLR